MVQDAQQPGDVVALEREVAAARQAYHDLVDDLAGRLRPQDNAMRTRSACPGCGGRTLIHATEVLDRGESFARSKMALVQPSWWRQKGEGRFEAWICASCGLVEWYVTDTATVAARADGAALSKVQGAESEPDHALADELALADERATAPARLRAVHNLAAGLQAGLDRLLARHLGQRGALNRTMRGTRRCPLCGGAELLHAREVLDRADGPSRLPMALEQPGCVRTAGAGLFTAWICLRCGVVEWYVPDLFGVSVDGQTRRTLEGPPAAEPPPRPLSADSLPGRPDADAGEAELQRWTAGLARHVDAITARIRALRQRAARAPAGPAALSSDQRCPACAGAEILHAASVLDRAETGREEMALVQRRRLRLKGEGTFAAWICTDCGLVEWRIPDISRVSPDGKQLRLVQGARTEGAGPFR